MPSWSPFPSQNLTIAVHTICLVSGSLERGCVIYTCDRWFCWSCSLASADGQLAALPTRKVVCRVRLLDLDLCIQRCRNKPTTVQSTQNTKARIKGASDPWMQLVEVRGVVSTAIAGLRGDRNCPSRSNVIFLSTWHPYWAHLCFGFAFPDSVSICALNVNSSS